MDTKLELRALPHPDPRVQRAGFTLTSPYVEQCWGAVVGPSGVAILRRMPVLWAEHQPAVVATDELARSIGLGASRGDSSRFRRTLDRVCRFGLAQWVEDGATLGVHPQVGPISDRQLARLPEWTQRAHDRLLGEHLEHLAGEQPRASVTAITDRLDRLQQRATGRSPQGFAIEP